MYKFLKIIVSLIAFFTPLFQYAIVYTVDFKTLFKNEKALSCKEHINIIYALTSLQGLANREKPTLYFFATTNIEYSLFKDIYKTDANPEFLDIDRFWFNWILDKGYVKKEELKELTTLEEILLLSV